MIFVKNTEILRSEFCSQRLCFGIRLKTQNLINVYLAKANNRKFETTADFNGCSDLL